LDVGKAARLLIKRPAFKLEHFYDETDWSALTPFRRDSDYLPGRAAK
jgi:hypothetical protein